MIKQIKKYSLLLLLACFVVASNAQITAFRSGYFQNQYLFNPAMSGQLTKKGSLATGYQKQTADQNSPSSIYLTGEYGFGESMGAGLNVFYDKAGLFKTVKVMGTYSYHINLGKEDHNLSFGISAGGTQLRFDNYAVIGDGDDPSLYNYNDKPMKFEADFGVAYLNKELTVQLAFQNMVSSFRDEASNIANQATLFAAVSYKWRLNGDASVQVEPKIAYRGLRDVKDVLDIGANCTALDDKVNVFALYHTSKNFSAGAGVKIAKQLQVLFAYSSLPQEFKSYSAGNMELGLKFVF